MNVITLPLTDLNDFLQEGIDAFICCASFESRCRAVANHLDSAGIKQVILVENSVLNTYNGENAEYLRHRYEGKTIPVELDMSDPAATEWNMAQALSGLQPSHHRRYLIDITTFTRESLLILLNLLRNCLQPKDSLHIVYTPATRYFAESAKTNLPESNTPAEVKRWLSKGVREVRSVIGFPGKMLPSLKIHLIVLAGFESDRAEKLIEQYEPHEISIGCGLLEGSFSPALHTANVHFRNKVSSLYRNVHLFDFWPNDPFKTKEALVGHAAKFSGHNTVIAPLNTKVSTVGSALMAFDDNSVQLCYAQGDIYNYDNYAAAGEDCCIFELSDLAKSNGGIIDAVDTQQWP